MSKKKHYPPSYVRYQLEHPPVTIHLNKRLKKNLDAIKKGRSYSQLLLEILEGAFNIEKEIEELPVSESLVAYIRGFKEAKDRYSKWDVCNKCGRELPLWRDGKCDLCHKLGSRPDFSCFRDMESASLLTDEDFEKARVRMPALERLSYRNGMKRGYNEGYGEGYDEAFEIEHFTAPCSVCRKPMYFSSNSRNWIEVRETLKSVFNNWRHTSCSK